MTVYKKAMITATVILACAILFANCLLGYDIDDLRRTAWVTPANATALSDNIWIDDEIAVPQEIKWYEILEGAHPVWWNDKKQGDGSKTLDIEVYMYYSNGTGIELSNNDSAWDDSASYRNNNSPGGKVYLMVRARNNSRNTGTYSIAYSRTGQKPASSTGGGDTITLDSRWYERYLSAGETHHYRFQSWGGNMFAIVWADSNNDQWLPISSTADIKVRIKRESDSSYFMEPTDSQRPSGSTNLSERLNSIISSVGYNNNSAYIIVEVCGYDGTSQGNYAIRYYNELPNSSEPCERYLFPGTTHRYDFYPGSSYSFDWADSTNMQDFVFPSPANIKVGVRQILYYYDSQNVYQSVSSYTVPLTDGDGNNKITSTFNIPTGYEDGYLQIEVQGYDTSSQGSYIILY